MNNNGYTAWQWIWGLPQTLVGSVLYIKNKGRIHCNYHGACVTIWDREGSISLGKFIFIDRTECKFEKDELIYIDQSTLVHEYGHTIQSIILGPLYLIVIGLPSIIWCNHPYFVKKRKEKKISYFEPFFERTANILGEAVTKQKTSD
ncbi:MAG: hypothetical protein IKN54_02935 [Lachnospiraceae bacterium]|nr:hypothetical protein [Lachnospiraceae bacterium]